MRLTEVWPGWPSGPQSDMSHDLIQSEAMDKAEVKRQRLPRARGPRPGRLSSSTEMQAGEGGAPEGPHTVAQLRSPVGGTRLYSRQWK